MRGSLWLLPESRIDQGGDFIIINRSRSTGSQFVVEPHQTLPAETTAPLPDCGTRETKLLSYLMVGETTITQQHDPGTPNLENVAYYVNGKSNRADFAHLRLCSAALTDVPFPSVPPVILVPEEP